MMSDIMEFEDEFAHVKLNPIWLQIVRFVKREDHKILAKIKELNGYDLLVNAECRTVNVLEYISMLCGEDMCKVREKEDKGVTLNPISQLDTTDPNDKFWYSWGADKAGLKSKEQFEEFCKYAGVIPANGIEWSRWKSAETCHFLSEDKKLIFTCGRNPTKEPVAGYVHYFGMTGTRARVKWLAKWFHDNGTWAEICYGGRDFI